MRSDQFGIVWNHWIIFIPSLYPTFGQHLLHSGRIGWWFTSSIYLGPCFQLTYMFLDSETTSYLPFADFVDKKLDQKNMVTNMISRKSSMKPLQRSYVSYVFTSRKSFFGLKRNHDKRRAEYGRDEDVCESLHGFYGAAGGGRCSQNKPAVRHQEGILTDIRGVSIVCENQQMASQWQKPSWGTDGCGVFSFVPIMFGLG